MRGGRGGGGGAARPRAGERVGRLEPARPACAALALNVNASIVTAVGNDYGFAEIFARQVAGLGGAHDVLLVISTSGDSENCVRAVAAARETGLAVHGWLGRDGGALAGLVDGALIAPGDATATIQEVHITLGHILCRILESWRLEGGPR
ncbi:SIS domain-containing protein [bacterium]|nr:SIS domain-containing protein [bacterium]